MSAKEHNVTRFVSNLRKSGLVEGAELEKVLTQCATMRRSSREELEFLANALLGARLLTDWQVTTLLNGKYRGFVVDDFLLLNRLESNSQSDRYLARDRKRDREVVLKFSRPERRWWDFFSTSTLAYEIEIP